ncbi:MULTISPECIES: DUF6575 domain-containing protein [Vibrio harveyi group]|nr:MULTISPECIES: DUF6575 domain-containing protein [Vibrio harveyi group]MCX8774050.1 hypothetical protein [Vibrio parahaemolyticus]MDF4906019.1 hypothetical protein [Vibrio parahaemolyticus]HCE5104551.1 hypothetical protein [Vibrio parahaemolyticus]HCG5316848.1 hypothetical protein [Vibrio parahaemolyticus]HCG5322172.1 hypothetical protein [Vibrio parahaemolyticus]
MYNITGQTLDTLPLGELEWKRDLIYFDGPLLSEFLTEHGETYLKYWCDCDENYNRWLYFKVKEQDRLRLVNGEKSVKEVMKKQPDSFFFLADEGIDSDRYQLVNMDKLPEHYFPKDTFHLSIEDYEEDENTTSLLFEDEWDFEDLKDIYRKFTQIHDFIFASKGGLTRLNSAMPWQGGFSAYHFYNKIRDALSLADRSKLDAIHYASPGYMKISAKTVTADATLEAINTYAINKEVIDRVYLELQNRIKELDLNNISPDRAVRTFSQDPACKRHSERLISLLGIPVSWLDNFVDTDFERTKMVQAHIRRLKQFYSYIEERNVRVVSPIINR